MSEKTRRAEQRRLRKAVGDDAMALMGAMSGVLADTVFPAQDALTKHIQALDRRILLLEGLVMKLQATVTRLADTPTEWPQPADAQATGAEVV